MKYIWNNGSPPLEKRVGNKICGLKRGGSRPDALLLTSLDFKGLLQMEESVRNKYLRVLYFSLKYEKEIDENI